MVQRRRSEAAAALAALAVSCTPAPRFPWSSTGDEVPFEHADVRTLNADYRRTEASILLREVSVPTRAALDFAAYHANFIIADAAPEDMESADETRALDTKDPFDGVIDKATLSGDVRTTPLSDEERSRPLAFPPLVEFLQAQDVEGAQELEHVGSEVREEAWGLQHRPGLAKQSISEVFVHSAGSKTELWAKIEFQPWLTELGPLPDQDGDGVPEMYGKVDPAQVKSAIFPVIEEEYRGRRLSLEEVKTWANRLASYWYPSFNTDLVPPGPAWPDTHTEPAIKKKLGGKVYEHPTIVLRGKPHGEATYQLFFVKGLDGKDGSGSESSASKAKAPAVRLPKTRPTPDPSAAVAAVDRELEEHGGSYAAWVKAVAPATKALRGRLRAMPPKVKALAGSDGFLFFRNSLEYVVAGDLEKQKKGKNPLPV
ncbi:MAG TPA: hypothetical protein VIM73_21620, partial [Polyangiaceae bacterium]